MKKVNNQKVLNFVKVEHENVEQSGYKRFNNCNHYVVDMSHLHPIKVDGLEDWMNTISIKLPNGRFATICVMQCSVDQTCLDISYHNDDDPHDEVRLLSFSKGRSNSLDGKGLYSLIVETDKRKKG